MIVKPQFTVKHRVETESDEGYIPRPHRYDLKDRTTAGTQVCQTTIVAVSSNASMLTEKRYGAKYICEAP